MSRGSLEIRCDHREDEQVAAAFARVGKEAGAIDILVNNVWGGYERMMEDGVFTWSKPFWEQPLWRWDAMFDAGVRAHYYASQLAARSMVGNRERTDREYLVLGGAEAHRQRRLWCVQSSD